MNLNTEEYTVLMQAINNARAEIADEQVIFAAKYEIQNTLHNTGG